MKKIIILTALAVATGIYSNVNAQTAPVVAPPLTTGDKSLQDTNIKTRSIDLERVDRDAATGNSTSNNAAGKTPATAEDKLAAKYEEIKTDYEQIQLSQDAVIKTYQSGNKIDYAQISKFAFAINSSAARLNSNLFSAPVENSDAAKMDKHAVKAEKEVKPSKSVRDLIVDLDGFIGSFATSPMFQNLRTVDAKISEKAKSDLEKIIELSAMLKAEAGKMTIGGK